MMEIHKWKKRISPQEVGFANAVAWRETDRRLSQGEWIEEPDKVHWIDPETDMDCLIVRGPSGALCGYVAVTKDHPYFGVEYSECAEIEVHGHLNYSEFCAEDGSICHVPSKGRAERVWWLGFSCAHSRDLCPRYTSTHGGVYRTLEYVRRECESAARQLAAMQ